jgi:hypothetical protein
MNPADEDAAKLVPAEGQPPGAVAGSHDDLEEQLHATLKDLQSTIEFPRSGIHSSRLTSPPTFFRLERTKELKKSNG